VTRSCRITPWQSSFSQSDSVSVESEARLVRAFSFQRLSFGKRGKNRHIITFTTAARTSAI
jgi:hypothetical protein